ncbi:cohesin domain-containing protein [Paenibacillus plantarum]|uniref:cohesin domain-containing protein n=1 Tax=Paenibacillus plantarum TaxID=2654975 RepID=UPI001FEB8F5C|nr:cohesin domain-containing protein [Paenibacillus plantarum]
MLVLLLSVSILGEVAPWAVAAQPQADVRLSSPPIYSGVTKAWPGDADKDPTHAATTVNGTACWATSQNPLNPYLYVDVAGSAKPAGATYAIVSVDYFDAAATTMAIEYDGQSNAYQATPWMPMSGSQTWKNQIFELSGIKFANGTNGADFRLRVHSLNGVMPGICIARIRVTFATTPALSVMNPNLLFTTNSASLDFGTVGDSVSYDISDDQGVSLRTGSVPVGTNGHAPLSVMDLGPGFYNLTFSSVIDDQMVTRATTFGIVTPMPAGALSPDSFFGIDSHFGHYKSLEDGLMNALATIGYGHIRSDINWSLIEKQPGVYNWAGYAFEAKSQQSLDLGMTPQGVLAYNNANYDNGKTPSSAAGLAAFGQFGKAAAEHYKGKVSDFNIYNEFNGTGFNNGACGITAACYLQMLQAMYGPIHEGNPDANVMGPIGATFDDNWFSAFFAAGGINYIDTFATNVYGYALEGANTPPERTLLVSKLPALVQQVKQAAGNRHVPFWITENGWPTYAAASTEPQQADNLVRAQVLVKAAGVDVLNWYSAMDDGTDPTNREHHFGLFRQPVDGVLGVAPKPGAVANAVLIRAVTGKTIGARDDLGSVTAYSYPNTGGDSTTRVMWSTSSENISLHTSQPLIITDEYGATQTVNPTDGKVVLTLNGSPIYVTGNVDSLGVTQSAVTVKVADQSIKGDTVTVTVTADRSNPDTDLPNELTITANGSQPVNLLTSPGQVTSATVSVPASTLLGPRTVAVDVTRGDDKNQPSLVAGLRATTNVVKPFEISVQPTITSDAASRSYFLDIALKNNRASDFTPTKVAYQVGPTSGNVSNMVNVPASGTVSIRVPLSDIPLFDSLSYNVAVDSSRDSDVSSGSISYAPIEPANHQTLPAIDLATQATWVSILGTRSSNSDLSGQLHINYNNDALVIDATITDDKHFGARTPNTMWQTDSIQFSTYDRVPGQAGGQRVELGAALLDSGPSVYTFAAPTGQQVGPTPGAQANITQSGSTMHYVISVPWASLGFSGPPTQTIGMSFLVNDDDKGSTGDSRDGFLQWGSGVGTTPKDPALFRNAQLISVLPAPTMPQSTLAGAQQVNQGETFDVTMGLTGVTQSVYQQVYAQDLTLHYDPASLQFNSVTSLKDGFQVIEQKEAVPGHIRILVASVGANQGVLAQGDLLTIKFTAKPVTQATSSTVSVSNVIIANGQGNELQVDGSSREIQISIPSTPVDKSLLNALIASAQATYNAAVEGNGDRLYAIGSKAQLQSAIDTATTTANNTNAAQQQVDSAKAGLEAAIQVFNTKRITADVNGDGSISIGDLAIVAGAYGKQQGQVGWNEKADVNHDGKVDIEDLAIVARTILQ